MTALINLPRAAWRRQPQTPVGVNWGNPLTKNCVFLATSTKNIDLVANVLTDYDGPYSNEIKAIEYASNFSIFSVTTPILAGTRKPVFFLTNHIGPPVQLETGYDTASKIYAYAPGCFYVEEVISNFFVLNKQMTVGYSYDMLRTSARHYIYKDGVLAHSTNGIGPFSNQVVGHTQASHTVSSSYFDYKTTVLWTRTLLDVEFRELNTNPWQLFAPAPSRFYLIPSSGGATTHDVALTLAYTAFSTRNAP